MYEMTPDPKSVAMLLGKVTLSARNMAGERSSDASLVGSDPSRVKENVAGSGHIDRRTTRCVSHDAERPRPYLH